VLVGPVRALGLLLGHHAIAVGSAIEPVHFLVCVRLDSAAVAVHSLGGDEFLLVIGLLGARVYQSWGILKTMSHQ